MDPEKMQQMLAGLWQQHWPAIMERVEILERAHRALLGRSLTPAAWEEAKGAAHKLAGVLGTFGRQDGTELARRIENWPTDEMGLPSQPEALGMAVSELQKIISQG